MPARTEAAAVRPADDTQLDGSARWAAAAVATLALAYAWIIGAGSVTAWPPSSTYYSQLAAAFAAGQTHLLARPDPAMLALPDPYDPVANVDYRLHDGLLYDGKYYLYWGPVPAVLLLPFAAAGALDRVGDAHVVLGLAAGTLAAAALLLHRVRRRLFPDRAGWTVTVGVLIVGVAGPLPFLVARPSVYEAAILGGQCFLLAGLCCAHRGLFPESTKIAGGRTELASAGWLAAAAACWSAAVGSRLSLAPAIAVIGLVVLWRVWRRGGGSVSYPAARHGRRALARTLAFALPAAAGAALFGAYNHARFGGWLQTGWQYQLGGVNVPDGVARGWLLSPRYGPANLMGYLCESPAWVPEFPFVYAGTGGPLASAAGKLSPHYGTEAVVGVMPVWPVLCLGLLALLPSLWRRHGRRPVTLHSAVAGPTAAPGEAGWLAASLAVAAVVGFAPGLLLCGITLRYLADLTPAAGVLAVVGIWLTAPASDARRPRRWAWAGGVGVLTVFSVATGAGLAFTGYHARFDANSPGVMRALRITLSPWATEPPPGVPPPGLH